jgi:hypothetical protein
MRSVKADPVIQLPICWYYSIADVAERWHCHPDRLWYWFVSGTLIPAVLVPKHLLPIEAQHGLFPSVCVVLENFRSLVWQYSDGDAVALLEGDFASFYTDGDGFRIIPLEIKTALPIARSQLVLLEEQLATMEENCASATAYRPNGAEQKASALVIRALAMKAYPDDIAHPYRLASKVCASIELEGGKISRETVAQKLKTALAGATVRDTACEAKV